MGAAKIPLAEYLGKRRGLVFFVEDLVLFLNIDFFFVTPDLVFLRALSFVFNPLGFV